MSQSFTTQLGTVATVPLKFLDLAGTAVPNPPGGSATSDNDAIATVTVAADDSSIAITAVAEGAANLTYVNGALSAVLALTVGPAGAATIDFDTAAATFAPV